MCTHAIWIHCTINAYFHPRDVGESGESSILQHGLESIYSIPCVRIQAEHAFVCQWIYYMCQYHRDWEDAYNRSDYFRSLKSTGG